MILGVMRSREVDMNGVLKKQVMKMVAGWTDSV